MSCLYPAMAPRVRAAIALNDLLITRTIATFLYGRHRCGRRRVEQHGERSNEPGPISANSNYQAMVERASRTTVNWPPFFTPSPGVPLPSFFLSRCSSHLIVIIVIIDAETLYPLGIGSRVTQATSLASRGGRFPSSAPVSGLLRPGGVLALRHGSHDLDPGPKMASGEAERGRSSKKIN